MASASRCCRQEPATVTTERLRSATRRWGVATKRTSRFWFREPIHTWRRRRMAGRRRMRMATISRFSAIRERLSSVGTLITLLRPVHGKDCGMGEDPGVVAHGRYRDLRVLRELIDFNVPRKHERDLGCELPERDSLQLKRNAERRDLERERPEQHGRKPCVQHVGSVRVCVQMATEGRGFTETT